MRMMYVLAGVGADVGLRGRVGEVTTNATHYTINDNTFCTTKLEATNFGSSCLGTSRGGCRNTAKPVGGVWLRPSAVLWQSALPPPQCCCLSGQDGVVMVRRAGTALLHAPVGWCGYDGKDSRVRRLAGVVYSECSCNAERGQTQKRICVHELLS
jgi:hypothetical protein